MWDNVFVVHFALENEMNGTETMKENSPGNDNLAKETICKWYDA